MEHFDFLENSELKVFLDNLAEEVHIWELLKDNNGNIRTWKLLYVNPPTLKTWGRKSLGEIKGKTTDEIFGPGATEHYLEVVNKAMKRNTARYGGDGFLLLMPETPLPDSLNKAETIRNDLANLFFERNKVETPDNLNTG